MSDPIASRLRRRMMLAAGGATALAASRPAWSQGDWPNKPVRVVVNFQPGGLTDAYGRQYGEALSRTFGQSFVVENRTGAGGQIGADAVAKSAADGYTLLVTTSGPVWMAPELYTRLPYDPAKDFTPISLFPAGPLIVGVPNDSPIRNLDDLLAAARSKPLNFGSYGVASLPHMMAEVWNRDQKTRFTPIHYKGESPMWVDLATAQVEVAVGSYQGFAVHQTKGTARAIAVTGTVRSPRMPETPTLGEQGAKEVICRLDGWIPFVAPAATPGPIIERISKAVVEGANTPKLASLRETYAISLSPTPLAETRERWAKEGPEWAGVARSLGIKLD